MTNKQESQIGVSHPIFYPQPYTNVCDDSLEKLSLSRLCIIALYEVDAILYGSNHGDNSKIT